MLKVKLKEVPVPDLVPLSNSGGLPVAVTVWVRVSVHVHVTVSPLLMVVVLPVIPSCQFKLTVPPAEDTRIVPVMLECTPHT